MSIKLGDINEDGPTSLKVVIVNKFSVGAKASMLAINGNFHDHHLNEIKWNVESLDQCVQEKMAELNAAGHAFNKTDKIISFIVPAALQQMKNSKVASSFGGMIVPTKQLAETEHGLQISSMVPVCTGSC